LKSFHLFINPQNTHTASGTTSLTTMDNSKHAKVSKKRAKRVREPRDKHYHDGKMARRITERFGKEAAEEWMGRRESNLQQRLAKQIRQQEERRAKKIEMEQQMELDETHGLQTLDEASGSWMLVRPGIKNLSSEGAMNTVGEETGAWEMVEKEADVMEKGVEMLSIK